MTTPASKETNERLLFVTSASGAGRTTAIKALEAIGFQVIENLPLSMMDRFLQGGLDGQEIALGIDVRNRDFSVDTVVDLIEDLATNRDFQVDLLFLDCRPEVLVRRYSETRHVHPLAPSESPEIGIERELSLLEQIRRRADVLIDTSELSPHDLRTEIERAFGSHGDRMTLSVESFSYKRGIPRGVDMVFDVRFLANPHWEPDLREFTGLSDKVADYVKSDPRFAPFFNRVSELVKSLVPAFQEEGKSYLTIAFGCTGGQHRSVALAESLSTALANEGWQVSTRHRELERRGWDSSSGETGKPD